MHSLEKIRENKKNNEEYFQKQLNYYKNPSAFSLVSKIIKHQNTIFIDNYCKTNNLNINAKEDLMKSCIKPNYYCPTVVQKKNREKLQCSNIK